MFLYMAFFLLTFAPMRKLFIIPVLAAVFTCCINNKSETVTASVFERKILPNGKLMILYAFKSSKGIITDSVVTEKNKIISDSLQVKFSLKNPEQKEVILH